MIFIPSIRIGGNPCGNDCTGFPCGEVDPCTDENINWNRVWRFRAYDSFTGDAGSIQSWSLKFPNGQVYSSTDTPRNIPDGTGSVSSYITVTGQPTTGIRWKDIKLSCNITHPYRGDLWVTLSPNETGSFWNAGATGPNTGSQIALIHDEVGGSADNVIITEKSLDLFHHNITQTTSSKDGLPVFDETTGAWVCGPQPSVNIGNLIDRNTFIATRFYSTNNWSPTWPNVTPAYGINRQCNTSRYIAINVSGRNSSFGTSNPRPVYLTVAGKTVLLKPGQFSYFECPYTADSPGTGFGTPNITNNSWQFEAVDKQGDFVVEWFPYVYGYPA
jgi:subtilisin-like proprotein convertase family protein